MESENGVTLRDENCAVVEKHVEESVPDFNIEGKKIDAKTEVPTINGVSESVTTEDEGINSSGGVAEAAATVPPGKNSKTKKVLVPHIFVGLSCLS